MSNIIIFDWAEKSPVYDKNTGTPENGYRDMKILTFETVEEAEKWKEEYLMAGNYPDQPHTVLEIIEQN